MCTECDDMFANLTELEYRQLAIWWYQYRMGYSRMGDMVVKIAAKYGWDDETLKKVARRCYERLVQWR